MNKTKQKLKKPQSNFQLPKHANQKKSTEFSLYNQLWNSTEKYSHVQNNNKKIIIDGIQAKFFNTQSMYADSACGT